MSDHAPTARRGSRWTLLFWAAAALVVLSPAVAMQLGTTGVDWSASDFLFAAAALGLVGAGLELTVRRIQDTRHRLAIALALAATLLLVWINGAVGIIGSEDEPANLVYAGVLFTALVGALLARFTAAGMVRAMLATAIAQAVAPVAALAAWPNTAPLVWTPQVLGLTVVFTGLWLTAGVLFRKAATAPQA